MLEEYFPSIKTLLDRTTVLYGASGSGKSTVMVDILHTLKQHADQIIVFCPTDKQNNTYGGGIVPQPCIHSEITPGILKDIWERQSAFSAAYKRANNPDIINRLYEMSPKSEMERTILDDARKKFEISRDEIMRAEKDKSVADPKIAEMKSELSKLETLLYKRVITQNEDYLRERQLSKDEEYSLRYINFNPRLVLVFDDCTSSLVKLKKDQVMQKIFYQGRWAHITAIFACHTDKALEHELKQNAFLSLFMSDNLARIYFTRPGANYGKDEINAANAAIKSAFSATSNKYQKLVFVREQQKFYRYTASLHEPFRFGSDPMWEFCKKIEAVGPKADEPSNKYSQFFQ